MPHYRFTLNEESYFADTELAGFNERNLTQIVINGKLFIFPSGDFSHFHRQVISCPV
jgi:hypothetical protein